MAGEAAFGTLLKMGATPTTIARVTKITGPQFSTEILDMTAHDSSGGYREIAPSFKSAGQVNFDLNFGPNQATHKDATGGLLDAFDNRALTAFVIVFPDTTEAAFSAYVTGFTPDAPFDDKLTAQCTLTISGGVTWTYPA